MERLIESIRASEAIQQSIWEARQRVERALAFIEPLPPSAAKSSLGQLALYIVDRNL
jgi:geranylgeranyl pyrophosphate synthase